MTGRKKCGEQGERERQTDKMGKECSNETRKERGRMADRQRNRETERNQPANGQIKRV